MLKWSKAATDLFELLLRDLPPDQKDLQRRHAIQEIEAYCEQTRIRQVGTDQVVIGYIRATPADRRMGLRQTMLIKGVMVQKYDEHFLMR